MIEVISGVARGINVAHKFGRPLADVSLGGATSANGPRVEAGSRGEGRSLIRGDLH